VTCPGDRSLRLRMVKHVLPRDTAVVAYDVDMADRLREILANEPGVVERPMFGGLAFMVAGHMAVSVSGQGGLLLRVDPAQTDTLVVDPRASRFVMRGREMDGWLRIDIDARASDDELNQWIKHGVGYARSLPPR
jgi:TfoX-like protein